MLYLAEIILFLLLVLLIRSLFRWLSHKRSITQTFSRLGIPGPRPSLFTGNYPEFLAADLKHETLDMWARLYGSVYGYYQGEKPFIVLSDTDHVQEVLLKMGRLFPNRQRSNVNVEPFLSSLLGLRGERWRASRRVLTPPFTAHKVALQTTKQTINESVKRLLVALESARGKSRDSLDVTRYMQSVTLDIISRLAFNMENTDDIYEDDSHLRHITTDFMKNHSPNLVLQVTGYFPFLEKVAILAFSIFGGGKLIDYILEHLNKCFVEYYQKRIRQKFSSELTDCHTGKVNILDYMMEQQEQGNLSQNELMGNAIILLLAGYETTATGLSFTLYLLAQHADIQEQLRAEILQIQRDSENYCHFDYNRCELLERVWAESLRLYPPVVTFTTRELDDSVEQVQLSKGKVTITREMTVQVATWTIHHNGKYWPEPYCFNPFRENLPFAGSSVKNAAYLPFGVGPRNCIGSVLANSEARAVLTALLSQYKIELACGTKENHKSMIDERTGLLKLTCKTVFINPEKDIFLKFTPISNLKKSSI